MYMKLVDVSKSCWNKHSSYLWNNDFFLFKKNGVKKMALDVSNNIIRCENNFILN